MHAERLDRARARMEELGVDVVLLSVGADLPYLTGYEAMLLERLTMLVRPRDGDATLVVPGLEARRSSAPDASPHARGRRPRTGWRWGMEETAEELGGAVADLRGVGVDVLTPLGQYLRPSPRHLSVVKWWSPDEFADLSAYAESLGFAHVESGPLVRSSYHARDAVEATEAAATETTPMEALQSR